MKKKKCAVLFSGGKDSCLALHLSKKKYEIKYLLSVIPKNFDSFMFHKPYLNLLEKQAEMLGMPGKLIIKKSKGIQDKELVDLKELITKVKDKVEVIVAGGIASSYQGNRIKKICGESGLEFYAPLLDFKGEDIWNLLLKKKFEVVITKISCEGLPKYFLGKVIDEKKFEELKKLSKKYEFRLDFEGGEAETAVLFMPEFKKHIKMEFGIVDEGDYRHWIEIKSIK